MTASHTSKFRHVESTRLAPASRVLTHLPVSIPSASSERPALAATSSQFAFVQSTDTYGGSVQVEALSGIDAAGKQSQESKETRPLVVHAHETGRVTAVAFSRFREDLLLSAGDAVATVKLWRVGSPGERMDELVTPVAVFSHDTAGSVVGIMPHPTAESVLATYSRRGVLRLYDVHAETMSLERAVGQGASLTSADWTWDGRAVIAATQDRAVRMVDPREHPTSMVEVPKAHSGTRPVGVLWCGRTQHFVTCGSDALMQEREFKLWDPRRMAKCVHRERVDAGGGGQLFPLYDPDVDLLFVLGKGSRSARMFEVDVTRAPYVHALNCSTSSDTTLAATLLPKSVCDTNVCEVARVLNLSTSGTSGGASCEVISYRVPRKEATYTFQSDLYPDTLSKEAAITSEEWLRGQNADPKLEAVTPTVKGADDMVESVFGRPTASVPGRGAPTTSAATASSGWKISGWGQALSSSASSSAPSNLASDARTGWRSSMRKWNEPEHKTETNSLGQTQWSTGTTWNATARATESAVAHDSSDTTHATSRVAATDASEALMTKSDESSPTAVAATTPDALPMGEDPTTTIDSVELSDKARRLGAKYGHKLKYVQGKEAPRNDVFYFGDKRAAFSTQASPVIAASATYWAAPIVGAGGPVLVEKLGATGKAQHGAVSVLNGQKAMVSALAFNPFADNVLATGSADSTIQLWTLPQTKTDASDAPRDPSLTLSGHTKGVRTLQFNPTAADVLCSTSHDLSLRFWDVETGHEKLRLERKLDDIAWNMAFSSDGALLATASRAKIVRVFDPRQSDRAVVTIGCGHESNKPQFVTWVDLTRLLTIGVNERSETQVSFWDPRNLVEPVGTPALVGPAASAGSTTTPLPLYDSSSRLLFLVGTGSRHIWSYEVDPIAATVQPNLPFMMTGTDTIGGVALLPKKTCNVRDVELARLLVATPNVVEQVSFFLPRAQKLKDFFQDDVFGLVPKQEPSLTAAQWFAGEPGAPLYESLQPPGMVPLSEKLEDVAPPRPKTLDFQARRREAEEKKRQMTDQFARLSTLATQPSLHFDRYTGVDPPAPQIVEDDSDDDWD
uniref:Coronin n=1 Tax=Peronospora matthiolae TaxID=2874970 RepID=A0AAV1TKJ4_9STRA